MKEINAQDIKDIIEDSKIPPRMWNTNSDSLCNYMRNMDFLKSKLEKRALIPRYVVEPIRYLGVSDLWRVAFPMICFCDIPFSKIRIHIDRYGGYGLAFDKTKLLEKYGLQPIHYISEKSSLKSDFNDAFQCSMDNDIDEKLEPLADYLLSTLAFMKPVYETRLEEGEEKRYIFQNECEWRYVPGSDLMPDDMDYILKNEDATKIICDLYSDSLEKHKEAWLKFEWDDVKYIIVPNEKRSMEIISFIRNMKIDECCKDVLISEIEVSERFLGDV